MAKYTCQTCEKTFTQKGHLEGHQKRKRPCKKDTTIETLVEQKVKEALLKTDVLPVMQTQPVMIDYSTKTREELISLCKESNIKGYSGKKKSEIIKLLPVTKEISLPEKIHRLNYIGSKFQLLDWITSNMKENTGWTSFENRTIADLFAGTGIVSYYFRKHKVQVISNDAELYSSVITHAFTRSTYSETCQRLIDEFQKDIESDIHSSTVGFVTTQYSPYESNERKFFTIENAQRIDYLRSKLESIKNTVTENDYTFILASILLSADAVSNVPAVYGCFLKEFKTKALKPLVLTPIHNNTTPAISGSMTYNSDVLDIEFLRSFKSDLVYLDPPYNERQYSKNYFPLNIIAKTPESLLSEEPLKGKTGIPTDCFISPFCKKGETVESAFDLLFRELKTKWIFLSYNSESLISKERMLEMMEKYGTASVIEREYKRFKSFDYNKDVDIKEYLFCLKKN